MKIQQVLMRMGPVLDIFFFFSGWSSLQINKITFLNIFSLESIFLHILQGNRAMYYLKYYDKCFFQYQTLIKKKKVRLSKTLIKHSVPDLLLDSFQNSMLWTHWGQYRDSRKLIGFAPSFPFFQSLWCAKITEWY